MDVVFDIDGTLANAAHRMHFINDPDKAKDWENFLSDEEVAGDLPIPELWSVLEALLESGNRVIFITGRPERQRLTTYNWLYPEKPCEHRALSWMYWNNHHNRKPVIYMRKDNDRRPSHIVKEEALKRAIDDGFNPKLVFEDRKDDTEMWRRNGLVCAQVAEGNF